MSKSSHWRWINLSKYLPPPIPPDPPAPPDGGPGGGPCSGGPCAADRRTKLL